MKRTRREFVRDVALGVGVAGLTGCATNGSEPEPAFSHAADAIRGIPTRPNVVLIISDDQGYGDLGCHGNPHLKTPHFDTLYAQSTRLTQFHVCPVCTPTRASLMTGRYNYRTGAIDTYRGRAMMHPDEITLPQVMASAGYRTGIFGKWHLGDCYPMRAMDQGFQEALVHNGGGLTQPSDPPGNTYFDPILMHNGVEKKYTGYCTDIFTTACIDFIRENKEQPFFAYLATNAPHTPLQIADTYVEPYRKSGLSEPVAKVYGMIANLDENIGRLMSAIDEAGIANNTIVVFMTDNGPQAQQAPRYNAHMRGLKTTVYEGGIRVPFFIRWPHVLKPGHDIDRLSAHIDVMPTLLAACHIEQPAHTEIDGVNLLDTLLGAAPVWPDRTIFTQWHRGDVPELYVNCMARNQRYKLVNGVELYDLETDPAESRDIAKEHPDIAAQLRAEYEAWFRNVSATRGYDPPRIYVGAPQSPRVWLTQQDWRGVYSSKGTEVGYWELEVITEGAYEIDVRLPEVDGAGDIDLEIGGLRLTSRKRAADRAYVFADVPLVQGAARLRAWTTIAGVKHGARYVYITKK